MREVNPLTSATSTKPVRHIGVFDATMLVMGGIVGGGIFVNPSVVAGIVHTPGLILGAWAVGGVIALAGAFVYAELASRLPAAGGHYAYMREAFHPAVAFMFGWAVLLVVQTGGIAATAVAFARYFRGIVPMPVSDSVVAVVALALITGINCAGLRAGNTAQRTFMLLKIAAIVSIVGCGIVAFLHGGMRGPVGAPPLVLGTTTGGVAGTSSWSGGVYALLAALTPVMFAYGGWQTASFVAAELKHPARDLSRAMVYGVLGVVALYLSINAVCLLTLGANGLAATKTPAAQVVDLIVGGAGGKILSTFVAISTFGFLAQSLFTVPRLYQVMAADGLFFKRVAYISPKTHVPTTAILLQGVFAAALAAAGTYEAIMSYVIAVDFLFYGLAALALFLFYKRHVGAPSYSVPGHPWTTLFFMIASWGVVAATITHDPRHALTGIVALCLGLPAYFVWRRVVTQNAAGVVTEPAV